MHTDICLTNATAIQPWLRDAAHMLETLADELDDATALQQRFEHAKAARDDLLAGDAT
jgi:prephenate dehydrogenase